MNKYLPKIYQPKIVTLQIPSDISQLITAVEKELQTFAQKDANKCWGYFPALAEKNLKLSKAKKLHERMPVISQLGKNLELNFVRLSLVQQKGDNPYHMDSDSKTALTGDTTTIGSRHVWRLLLNFSGSYSRSLGYLDLNTDNIELTAEDGYIHYVGDTKDYEKRIIIPPRTKNKVTAVLFCASRVLHTGKDDKNGHFVAGFGCEEPV